MCLCSSAATITLLVTSSMIAFASATAKTTVPVIKEIPTERHHRGTIVIRMIAPLIVHDQESSPVAIKTTSASNFEFRAESHQEKKGSLAAERETKVWGQPRIVGGTAVTNPNAYPWYANSMGRYLCGSSLVHVDILVTAAHCRGAFLAGGVSLGGNVYGKGTLIGVDQELQHPKYNSRYGTYDIMLVKLSSPVNNVTLINWWPNRTLPSSVTVIGYGTTSYQGPISTSLLEVVLPVQPNNKCSQEYQIFDPSVQICAAGLAQGGKDSCQGDSGGPLFVGDKLYGLVSSGYGCASPGVPGINTRVSAFKVWMRQNICQLTSYPGTLCGPAKPSLPPNPSPSPLPTPLVVTSVLPTTTESPIFSAVPTLLATSELPSHVPTWSGPSKSPLIRPTYHPVRSRPTNVPFDQTSPRGPSSPPSPPNHVKAVNSSSSDKNASNGLDSILDPGGVIGSATSASADRLGWWKRTVLAISLGCFLLLTAAEL